MVRFKLNGGHAQIAVAGVTHKTDELGCFELPDNEAAELLRVYGGTKEASITVLEEAVAAAKKRLSEAKGAIPLIEEEVMNAEISLENFKKVQEARKNPPPADAKKSESKK